MCSNNKEVWSKMDSEVKVEVIHKETITPSSPTPDHLTTCNLSVFDQCMPNMYIRLLLFYPSNISGHEIKEIDHHHHSERCKLLKRSLSEILSHFYPFAGRISLQHNMLSICCNDHGAAFIEARVNCPISKILEKPDDGMLNQFLPTTRKPSQESTGYLLLVQANFFECGGLAIGVSISHKIADSSTLGTFIRSWAAMGLGSDVVVLPAAEFGVTASVYPPQQFFINSSQPAMQDVGQVCGKRRFVFDASKIAFLKSKAASTKVPNPTRVEVVSALIWKCAMEASRSNLGCIRPSVFFQSVNMRKVMGKPNLMGNLVGVFAAKTEDSEANLKSLVAILRRGIEEFKVKYGNGVSRDDVYELYKEYGHLMGEDDTDNYNCTSWCRFPFYEANFGWGKPSWVSIPGAQVKNVIVLLDTKDGDGIEAFLSFKEEDMVVIETNEELLAYATLNPTVI